VDKGITEYYARADRASGLQSHCKECEKVRNISRSESLQEYSKKSYEANKEEVCKRSALKGKEKLEYIDKLKEGPCVDCGQSFPGRPEVMDFDHKDDGTKHFNVSSSRWKRYEEIEAEIAKCELVCANCHRTRTKTRGQYARSAKLGGIAASKKRKARENPAPSVDDLLKSIV
jgi:hypothetical protein